ncbi:DUF302 domain-containing protein [Litorimonas sp.]|uniref:DUF302 domain-containing protein n=1 Tax=Litorimonas sp. TaxID=1892381 RepID=UPI003A85E83C
MKNLFTTLCLTTLVSACSPSDGKYQTKATSVSAVTMTENMSFETVEENLRQALQKRDLKLFTVVDHGEGAESVGMDIGQSKLFIFGNPKSGTPLMVANREMGVELPMKILIFENGRGEIGLRRTDIKALAAQYDLTDQEKRIQKIDMTLNAISEEAVSGSQ